MPNETATAPAKRPSTTDEALSLRVKTRSLWGNAARRFLADRLAISGLVLTALFVFMGVFGPVLAPYDHLTQDLDHQAELPTRAHLLGTDHLN